MTKREEAYAEYCRRKRGESKPAGEFNGDFTAHAFRPDPSERRPCCPDDDRNAYNHCQSAMHVAHLFGLDAGDFTRYCRVRRCQESKRERAGGTWVRSGRPHPLRYGKTPKRKTY